MKSLHRIFLAIVLCALCTACESSDPNAQMDEGTIEDRIYTSEEIGWRIEIPEGWAIVQRSAMDKLQSKGKEAIVDSTGEHYDSSALKNLVGFQKDQFHIFQSTSEPFAEEYAGEWEENDATLRDVILQTYRDQGIPAEATEIETEEIGGLEFHKYSIKIFKPNGEILLNQVLYGRLINGLSFGVNINYNNEELGDEMLAAWRNSKFNH